MAPSPLPAVVFLQHGEYDPPAYLSLFLQQRGIHHIVLHLWSSHGPSFLPSTVSAMMKAVPVEGKPFVWLPPKGEQEEAAAQTFVIAAVASGGGHISANDPIPYYPTLFELIRNCVTTRTPYMGHCLGAQLLSVALGGRVLKAEKPECKWVDIQRCEPDTWESRGIKDWLPHLPSSHFFAIHGETFTIPDGCHLIASSSACTNQAVQVGDQFIFGTQFHPEVTLEKIHVMTKDTWLCKTKAQVEQEGKPLPPSMVTMEELYACSPEHLERSKVAVDHLYNVWSTAVEAKSKEVMQKKQ